MELTNHKTNIFPLNCLIGQAGVYGFLLLAEPLTSFFISRGRYLGYDTVDASASIQIAYTMLVFILSARYLMLPCGKRALLFLFSRPMVYLLLFVLICTFSFSWSDKPIYSAFMGFQSLAYLILLTVILDRLGNNGTAQDMVEWMMLWMVWLIFTGILLRIHWFGSLHNIFATEKLRTGIFFFLAIYVSKRKLFRWIVMAFALFSGANKMYAGMIPGFLLGIFSENRKTKLASSIGALVLISALAYIGLKPILQITVFHGRAGVGMEYTSGRDTIWAQSLELIREKPLLGYGFVSGERDRLFVNEANVISAHNMLISAAIGVGIIGPLLLLLYFLETTILCFGKKLPREWLIGFLATIGISFVFSMTGPGLGGRVYGAWVPVVFVMTMICMVCKSQRLMNHIFENIAYDDKRTTLSFMQNSHHTQEDIFPA